MTLDLTRLQDNPDLVRLNLPWPDSRLLPNRKLHWTQKRKATTESRRTAWAIAFVEMTNKPIWDWITVKNCTAHVTFHPPDKRRRDLDNLLRACKPYWDGMVDAGLLKDDSCIRQISVTMGEPDKHNARVEIELSEV